MVIRYSQARSELRPSNPSRPRQAPVAAAAGRPGDAARSAEAALALYRAKGNRRGAARAEAAAYATR